MTVLSDLHTDLRAESDHDPFIVRAAILWRNRRENRFTTLDIAKTLGTDEALVWNRFDEIKAAAGGVR